MIPVACESDTMIATLDPAVGESGLLIVSGGNEIRCGAHRGMALLAAGIAAGGSPVFRYDRRGIGDSTGSNRGFLHAREDLHAAVAAFRRAMPQLKRIVGFGNCDAASTLALFGHDAGLDRVVLANPWIVEPSDDLPPAAAIRQRYAERLRQPGEWRRLIRGQVDLAKLRRGVAKLLAGPHDGELAGTVLNGIDAWGVCARIVLARGDATAIAFAEASRRAHCRFMIEAVDSDSHSFARVDDAAMLRRIVEEELASTASIGVRFPI